MNCEIICVGTELLLGNILNTDAKFLSERLSALGINVFYQTVVGDNPERLQKAIDIAFSRCDMILFSGGLGPTEDDLTKETVARTMGCELKLHQESLDHIKTYFQKLCRNMTKNNEKQAMLPEGCIVFPNLNGTAPGCAIEKDGKIAILLPGPPSELTLMFNTFVFPYLQEKTNETIVSKTLRVFGIGESAVETEILDIIRSGQNPTVAPYAKTCEVHLRITAKTDCEQSGQKMIAETECKIRERIGEYIYGYDEDTLESVVVGLLKEKGLTLSTAESCTGGMIAEKITSVPGSSDVFGFGFVTYANQAKETLLGVDTLKEHGAVSEETAISMAEGALQKSGSDISVAVTGIAGPGGGTDEKPVGLVYIAAAQKGGKTLCQKHQFSGSRDRNRTMTAMTALSMLRKILLESK